MSGEDFVKKALERLKKDGWEPQKTNRQDWSGVKTFHTGSGEKRSFNGGTFLMNPDNRVAYTGNIGDASLEPAIPGAWPSEMEIRASMEFWFSDGRVAETAVTELMPALHFLCKKNRDDASS